MRGTAVASGADASICGPYAGALSFDLFGCAWRVSLAPL